MKNHLTAITIGLVLLSASSFHLSGQTPPGSRKPPEALKEGPFRQRKEAGTSDSTL